MILTVTVLSNYSYFSFLLILDKRQIMSTKYKATTTDEAYFITITTVGWIDVFTRLNQKYNMLHLSFTIDNQ